MHPTILKTKHDHKLALRRLEDALNDLERASESLAWAQKEMPSPSYQDAAARFCENGLEDTTRRLGELVNAYRNTLELKD